MDFLVFDLFLDPSPFFPPGCFSNVFTEAGLNSETAVSGAEGADSKASWGQVWPRSGPKAMICDKIWA